MFCYIYPLEHQRFVDPVLSNIVAFICHKCYQLSKKLNNFIIDQDFNFHDFLDTEYTPSNLQIAC